VETSIAGIISSAKRSESMVNIVIDEEFKRVLPPLSDEVYAGLEASILEVGCRESLIIWFPNGVVCECGKPMELSMYQKSAYYSEEQDKNIPVYSNLYKCTDCKIQLDESELDFVLVDGHNRYEICTRHGVPFEVEYYAFDNRDKVISWIGLNQINRRNVTPDQEKFYRGREYNRKKKTKAEAGSIGGASNRQNDGYLSTSEILAEKHGISQRTIEREGAAASTIDNNGIPELVSKVESGEVPLNVAVIAATFQEDEQHDIIAEIEAGEKPSEVIKKHVHVSKNSGENEWYTPATFIEAARLTMGSIDLDPASSALANQTVNAATFYTAIENGLEMEWKGNVWLNPPYAQPLLTQFVEKLLGELQYLTSAIVLVNNATETKWFQSMVKEAACICFPSSRIKFIDKQGNPTGAPLQGQVLLYFGDNKPAFIDNFTQFGLILCHV
jgi:hypothetical protein